MILALAQLNYHIANIPHNKSKILAAIQEAKSSGADLIVFAEMALTGYPAKDLWLSPAFQRQVDEAILEIAAHCEGIACILGAPVRNSAAKGKPLVNAAVLLHEGKVTDWVGKSLVPDYDVFDEYRYFQPVDQTHTLSFKGLKLGVTICEDLWNVLDAPLYEDNPYEQLAKLNPDLMINIAASPFAVGHYASRRKVLATHQQQYPFPILYVNQVGAHADLIFDGRSLAFDADGKLLTELPAFREGIAYVEYNKETKKLTATQHYQDSKSTHLTEESELALVHQALVLGIRDYFQKSGFKKAVLGLSGGLDSAVVAALACEALGADQVVAVLMPSVYSSDHSIKDAMDLVENTGCHHHILAIHQMALAFEDVLEDAFAGLKPDTTEENIQARIRGTLLMAFSNKFGHTLLNTSNKSEMAVGYGTLYGDMAGAFSVIGDLFKTDVYRLAEYINREREIIPIHTIVKPPSAELRHDQKDSDSLPDYAILDPILRAYIEEGKDPDSIIETGQDPALVKRIIQMVDRAEFKRFQSSPVLRVSKKAFGPGRAMPLVAKINW